MRASRAITAAAITALALTVLPPSPAGAASSRVQLTGIASVTPGGYAGSDASTVPDVSADGRYIAFRSAAPNLVAGDTNGMRDIFVRDTLGSVTRRVSVASDGTQANGQSGAPTISDDGRFVAFESNATNLVANDTNGVNDIFRHDLWTGETVMVSVSSVFVAGNGDSNNPDITADGGSVVFDSAATNLVIGDSNAKRDVFIRNVSLSGTSRLSVTSANGQLTGDSITPAITGGGRYVAFRSTTNQIGSDTNNLPDIFVRDRTAETTERVSVTDGEANANGQSNNPDISDDGRYVVFDSTGTNLVSGDTNSATDVFMRDRTGGTTTRLSVSTSEAQGTGASSNPSISGDADRIAFTSAAPNLSSFDTNGQTDAFVRDRSAGTTARQSVTSKGAETSGTSATPAISTDGKTTTFSTTATGLGVGDTNSAADVWWKSSYERGPLGALETLIDRQYQDFDGRLPTALEALTATRAIEGGALSTQAFIDERAHGTFDDRRGPVTRLYWAFFKRLPDAGGFTYWLTKNSTGTNLNTIANFFAQSSEFQNTYGNTSNSAYVTLVYNNVLDRSPDAGGLSYWVAQLDDGLPRGQMMVGFSESNEGIRLRRAVVDSVLFHLGMLGRLPTPGELTADQSAIAAKGGQPSEVIVNDLLVGAEYATRIAGT